jgi:hypothetical protein
MLGTDDIAALAVTLLLWIAAIVARVTGRRQAAGWLMWAAVVATVVAVALLHMGKGHRA